MEVLQHEAELTELVALYNEVAPKRVLEIGCWDGGTLREWMINGNPDLVVAVDDNHRNIAAYEGWRRPGCDLLTVFGLSQDAHTIAQVAFRGPYDWIFVDADHQYEPVLSDWSLYRPMCANGGRFLFHDISGGRSPADMGVCKLWGEIKEMGLPVTEIIHNNGEWGGVGVVNL